jgi:hypothetical protein
MARPVQTASDPVADRRHIPYAQILLLAAASRIALLAVGVLSSYLVPSGASLQQGNLFYHQPAVRALEIWARWDSEWYLLIADQGYDSSQYFEQRSVPYERAATAGFLPLYPLLIRWLTPLLGAIGAGVVISNLSLVAALLLLYLATAAEAPPEVQRSAGLAACVGLLVFPTSLFLSAVYSESLYLALSLAVFVAARRGRLAIAGIAGGLAALSRPYGALLVLPLLWEWWQHFKARRTPVWTIVWLAPIPLAVGAFALMCHRVFGDPLALLHRQARWRGAVSGPWQAFVKWWQAEPVAHGAHGSTFELIVALFVLALLPLLVRRLRSSYWIYAVAVLVVALGSTLWSFSRLVLTLFPLFVLAGLHWSEGRRNVLVFYGFLGATLSGLLMALFANWWWAG